MIRQTPEAELKRLETFPPKPSFYTVEDESGSVYVGSGLAHWAAHCWIRDDSRLDTKEAAERHADKARADGHTVEVIFHDMAAGRAKRIERLKAQLAA